MNNVTSSTYSDFRQSCGVGRIIIPSDVNRDMFVLKCLQTQTVSILCEGETAIHDVPCTSESIRNIVFPTDSDSNKGSIVVWIKEEKTNQLIVTGTLSNQTISNQQEGSCLIEQKNQETILMFQMTPDNRSIVLSGYNKNGTIFSQSFTGSNSLVEAIVNGRFFVQSKEFRMTAQDNFALEVESDENNAYIRASETAIEIGGKEVRLNEGTYSAVLGELLTNFLEKLVDEISKITVSTPQGQMSILNKIAVLRLKKQIDTLLSETVLLS